MSTTTLPSISMDDISVEARPDMIRLAAMCNGTGIALRLTATGDRAATATPRRRLFTVAFLVASSQEHGNDESSPLWMPELHGLFHHDIADFLVPRDACREEVAAMRAEAGFPAECEGNVAFFCTVAAGLCGIQGCSDVTVAVEMTEASTSGSDFDVVKYGHEEVVIREEGCGICLEGFVEGEAIMRLRCSHACHEACLLRWLRRQPVCPYCRAPVCGAMVR